MSDEIERKFLVADPDAGIASAARSERIRQGYVAVDPAGSEVRVREIGDRRVLTVKRGSGEVRAEVEFAIGAETFEELWELTRGRRVDKRRHFVDGDQGLVYELDVYEGGLAGLATVEVEFTDRDRSAAFVPPPWFGQDVTGDARYSNARLAIDGFPAATD